MIFLSLVLFFPIAKIGNVLSHAFHKVGKAGAQALTVTSKKVFFWSDPI